MKNNKVDFKYGKGVLKMLYLIKHDNVDFIPLKKLLRQYQTIKSIKKSLEGLNRCKNNISSILG